MGTAEYRESVVTGAEADEAALGAGELDPRRRAAILEAARAVFFQYGYDAATTHEIAARAKTSKRALYEIFGTKRGIVNAMIAERVREMRRPVELEPPASREQFFVTLRRFGTAFLSELLAPQSIALIRLAIAQSAHSAELGAALDQAGRLVVTQAITALFTEADARDWVRFERVDNVVSAYMYTLMGDVLMRLLLGTADAPPPSLLEERAELAIDVVRQFDRSERSAR